MKLEQGKLYHVYNRGNNQERIFLAPENYTYFMRSLRRYVIPFCDLLAWSLVPNKFQLLILASKNSVAPAKDASFPRQQFSQSMKMLLSSYAKAINKDTGRTGSLFQQKTKAIQVSGRSPHMPEAVFHLIHQAPVRIGLVPNIKMWPHSSFKEYLNPGLRKVGYCNRGLAAQLLKIDFDRFIDESLEAGLFSSIY